MKKLIFLFLTASFLIPLAINAQVNRVVTITADTMTKVETEYFAIGPVTGAFKSLAIQSLYTQLGGTSDGTAILQASVDGTSYATIIDNNYEGITFYGDDDTLTVNNGDIWQIEILNPSFQYYRIAATGTANDTTLVTVKYILK